MPGKMNYFMVRCTGNCGGSWLASAISAHPDALAYEELLTDMGLKKSQEIITQERREEITRIAADYFITQAESGQWKSIGVVKELLRPMQDYMKDKDPRIMWLVRNPVKVVGYKMGSKTVYLEHRMGREFKDEREMFTSHIKIYARHFNKVFARPENERLVKLEELSESLVTSKATFFRAAMMWLTRLDWTEEDVALVRQHAKPRKREHVPDPDCWKTDEYIKMYYKSPFPPGDHDADRWPSRGAHTWKKWRNWQRNIFMEHFGEIMPALGYEVDG